MLLVDVVLAQYERKVYSYEMLTGRDLPETVDRTRLEVRSGGCAPRWSRAGGLGRNGPGPRAWRCVRVVAQEYLADDEFVRVLGMSRAEFAAQPSWKQSSLKQRHGLY